MSQTRVSAPPMAPKGFCRVLLPGWPDQWCHGPYLSATKHGQAGLTSSLTDRMSRPPTFRTITPGRLHSPPTKPVLSLKTPGRLAACVVPVLPGNVRSSWRSYVEGSRMRRRRPCRWTPGRTLAAPTRRPNRFSRGRAGCGGASRGLHQEDQDMQGLDSQDYRLHQFIWPRHGTMGTFFWGAWGVGCSIDVFRSARGVFSFVFSPSFRRRLMEPSLEKLVPNQKHFRRWFPVPATSDAFRIFVLPTDESAAGKHQILGSPPKNRVEYQHPTLQVPSRCTWNPRTTGVVVLVCGRVCSSRVSQPGLSGSPLGLIWRARPRDGGSFSTRRRRRTTGRPHRVGAGNEAYQKEGKDIHP